MFRSLELVVSDQPITPADAECSGGVSNSRSGRSLRWWRTISFSILAIGFVLLALRQNSFTDRFSVNVMFGDQWDFYTTLQNPTLWRVFDRQHGLHRQGVGFVVTWILAEYGHWNSRWDAFGISYVLIGSALLGLILAWKCGVREPLALLAIPLLYLTRRQYEGFLCASNISCGSMPIFLFTLYCLAWFIKRDFLRLGAVGLLTFCLIFTGYGFFAGLITPLILSVELLQAWAKRERRRVWMVAATLLSTGVAWWMFSWNYLWVPAVDFRFPYEKPLDYFCFVGAMLANFYGVVTQTTRIEVVFGGCIAFFLISLCVIHGWRAFRCGVAEESRSVAIFALASYALIYCVFTAVGRVSLGWQFQAMASRYVTLMIPAGLAIFLHVASCKVGRTAALMGILYAIAIAPGSMLLNHNDWTEVQGFHDARQTWKAVYLATHDETTADRRAGIDIYPVRNAIAGRLHYLEDHHLNMFYQPEGG